MRAANAGSAMSGQLFLSKPGAVSSTLRSTSQIRHFSSSSTRKTSHGAANNLFPMPRTPPKESTTYAMRPDGRSIMMSSTVPRSSPDELRTESPFSVPAVRTRRYRLPGSVFLIFSGMFTLLVLATLAHLLPRALNPAVHRHDATHRANHNQPNEAALDHRI